jgi:outer membrane autotransporter protein
LSAYAGFGYVWEITEKFSLDVYGQYFWTRHQGDDVTLTTGDPVSFADVDSRRLRLGGRFTYEINDYLSPYIGAAWEREFAARQRATTFGYDIDTPSLRGDTGIGELWLSFKHSKHLPLSIDIGVQGYLGKREGATGNLQIKYEF